MNLLCSQTNRPDTFVLKIDSFEMGGFDTSTSIKWLEKAIAQVQNTNETLKEYIQESEKLSLLVGDLEKPDVKVHC